MRGTLYRGFDASRTNQYVGSSIDELIKRDVDPDTIGECTFKSQWSYQDPDVKGFIYEDDIVEVVIMRCPEGSNSITSQYDGYYYFRAVVFYSTVACAWRLDFNNSFNRRILKLRGNEQTDRYFPNQRNLGEYHTESLWRKEAWQRQHNSHHHVGNIKVVGNIHQSPDLLKADPAAIKKVNY